MKNHTMNERNALALTSSIETALSAELTALASNNYRAVYNATLHTIDLQTQLQAIYDATIKTPLEIVATSITIHSLKVLARGRKFINKDGVEAFTPANVQAQKLLEQGKHDTSGIIEDLTSDVTLAIWEAIASDTLTVTDAINPDGKPFPRLTLTNPDDTTAMRSILNVVQSSFYQNQQKHFAHEYKAYIDDDGNEADVMITAAMREYAKSIEYIGETALLESLRIALTDRESAVLRAKLQQKQVERTYGGHDNKGKAVVKRHFVSRYLTIAEIAVTIGITDKQVRVALASIKNKCENLQK